MNRNGERIDEADGEMNRAHAGRNEKGSPGGVERSTLRASFKRSLMPP